MRGSCSSMGSIVRTMAQRPDPRLVASQDQWGRMFAQAIESVDEPLEEDIEGICLDDCPGIGDVRCRCYGNEAREGEW